MGSHKRHTRKRKRINARSRDGCNASRIRYVGGLPCTACTEKGVHCNFECYDIGIFSDKMGSDDAILDKFASRSSRQYQDINDVLTAPISYGTELVLPTAECSDGPAENIASRAGSQGSPQKTVMTSVSCTAPACYKNHVLTRLGSAKPASYLPARLSWPPEEDFQKARD
jgi:hypothetical protein